MAVRTVYRPFAYTKALAALSLTTSCLETVRYESSTDLARRCQQALRITDYRHYPVHPTVMDSTRRSYSPAYHYAPIHAANGNRAMSSKDLTSKHRRCIGGTRPLDCPSVNDLCPFAYVLIWRPLVCTYLADKSMPRSKSSDRGSYFGGHP